MHLRICDYVNIDYHIQNNIELITWILSKSFYKAKFAQNILHCFWSNGTYFCCKHYTKQVLPVSNFMDSNCFKIGSPS